MLGIKCFLTHSGIDEFPNVSEKEINTAMPIIAKHGLPLLAHCEMYKKEVDNKFSDLYLSASADILVTNDSKLLALRKKGYPAIDVKTIAEFMILL